MNAVPSHHSADATLPLLALRELWVHTGTACNLSCPFCHQGSKPGDTRVAAPTLALLAPQLEAAAAAGVGRFIFTGGEPLIVRDIGSMLLHALRLAPCLVLTNGTAPLIRRSQQLQLLRAQPHALSFRVSIDYADEARHDAQRGLRNFRKALQGLRLLHEAGFDVSVARQQLPAESATQSQEIAARYRSVLPRHGLPASLAVHALPELGPPQHQGFSPLPGTAPVPQATLCNTGRMVLARNGAAGFIACPLVDDDARFLMGTDLTTAMGQPVDPVHPRCRVCRGQGLQYG